MGERPVCPACRRVKGPGAEIAPSALGTLGEGKGEEATLGHLPKVQLE
jgi:hypothetical protein